MLKSFSNKLVSGLTIGLLALSILILPPAPAEARYAGAADCDNNAIIRCGINSTAELQQKYRSDAFVRTVFRHFSIQSETAMNGMVKGRVTKSGEVWVGNERLATGAVTTGRIKMGADEVKVPGAEAWMRPPSRSFRSNSLEALVKLNSRGEFQFGVLMSCGNPVQAAHKAQKPAPKPTPPPQQPKPQPKPQPQPKPTPQPQPIPKQPKLEISKDVQVLTPEGWGPTWNTDEIEAAPGGQVSFRITVRNPGEADLKNIHLKDIMPEDGVVFQAESPLSGSPITSGRTTGDLIGDGLRIDTIAPGQSVEVIFRNVSIDQSTDACQTPLRNIATATADNVPDVRDDAEVRVCQPEEEEEEETPAAPTQPSQPQQSQPQVQAATTSLPATGAAGAVGVFSITSFLGFAAYKLKEFYSILLR